MQFIERLDFDFIDFLPFRERPFKAKFIPSQVWKELDKFKDDVCGLERYLKKWRTKVHFENYKDVNVGGCYDSIGCYCEIFVYSPTFPNIPFNNDTMLWEEFKYAFIQTLMHEIIHFMQFMNRDGEDTRLYYPFKVTDDDILNEERDYYSDIDEIRAYAHCIYLDFKTFSDRPITELIKVCKGAHNHTYKPILKVFHHDFTSNYALRVLAKEIIRVDNKYNAYLQKESKA